MGTFAGLIGVLVVAAMFITAEYRRGLIRTTLAASPRRGRVLAAKALVIGSVTFVAGLAAAAAAVTLGAQIAGHKAYLFPATFPTELRMVAGTAALLAVAAVLALALGAVLRRSVAAITIVVVAIVLPYLLIAASVLPVGVLDWLLRITPAAAFAIQQAAPRYPQVTALYSPGTGYYPLAPWAGFAVLCAWAALALGLAMVLIAGGTHEPGRASGQLSLPLTRLAGLAGIRELHAESTKLRTIAGPAWLLIATVAVTLAISAAAMAAVRCPSGIACPVDTAKLSLTGIQFGQAVVAILAILVISGEYSTGMIRTTFTAMPHRLTVLGAKAAILGGLVLAAGTIAVLACVLTGRLDPARPRLHRGAGFPPLSLADGPVLRAAAGRCCTSPDRPAQPGHRRGRREPAVAIGIVLSLL